MAKLILTTKEKKAITCLSFDDASLGRAVKYCATVIAETKDGRDNVFAITCAAILAGMAHKANADTMSLDLKGVTCTDGNIGDWQLVLRRKKAKAKRKVL